jgi:hypothetical protein
MKVQFFLLAGVLALLTSCSIQTSYDFDRTADFSQYKTFSIYQDGIDQLKLNSLDKKRIVSNIEQQLTAKGLTMVADKGDLTVNVLASSQKVVNVNRNPYWGWGYPWGYGYGWWDGNTSVSENRVGKLTLHLVDIQKNILVWEGVVQGFNVDNARNKDEQIHKAVEKVFYNYPPQVKKQTHY